VDFVVIQTSDAKHEGRELGYSLTHAYGAAFDNPDLIVACIIGDGNLSTASRSRVPGARIKSRSRISGTPNI
jgi:phosphoketolase